LNEDGYEPYNEKGVWMTSIEGFAEWEKITPLGGGSKISEEDQPL